MTKHKQQRPGRVIWYVFLGIAGLVVLLTLLLQGTDVALMNPKGQIADDQRFLILFSAALLLTIAVPTIAVLYFFAWKYRESNHSATYNPETRQSKLMVFGMWAVPAAFMAVLAVVMWSATHRLEPQKPIVTNSRPLIIQVVALRWKWLFIYPEQRIATVNFVQLPVGKPVQFDLTADEAPMSSFWIPHLGGQLYAMTGHINPLNLIADKPGDYPGSSAEINGAGFAGMRFTARAGSQAEFESWVQNVKRSPDVLDAGSYASLLKPSENEAVKFYSQSDQNVYATVLSKYAGSHGGEAGHGHQ